MPNDDVLIDGVSPEQYKLRFQQQSPNQPPNLPPVEVEKVNEALHILPPGGGAWTVPNVQQYVGIYQAYNKFYYANDEALRNNRENARVMFRNLVIREPLQARLLAAAELPWHVEPENKKDPGQLKVAEGVQRIIEEIPDFLKYRYDLLLAVWFGRYGVQNKYAWDYSTGKRRLIVKEWSPVHGDSLVYKWDSDDVGIYVGFYGGSSGTKELSTQAGQISQAHVLTDQETVYYDDKGAPYRKLGMNERDAFVIHSHDLMAGDFLEPEAAGGVKGVGIRSVIYWTWFTLQNITSWMIDFMERVGTGITLYKFIRGNQESYNAAKIQAESQSNQAAILVPVDPEVNGGKPLEGIERVEPSAVGLDNILRVVDEYFGGQIRRYIVGQDATSRPVPSGMNSGVAQAHENTFARIVKYDVTNLQETLTTQLVRVVQRWTYPETTFKCKFVIEIEKPDQKEYMEGVKTFVDLGGEVDEDEARSVLGLTKPDAGAKTLKKDAGGLPPGGGRPPVEPGPHRPSKLDEDDPDQEPDKPEKGDQEDDDFFPDAGPKRFEAGFTEGDHPRANDGKFTSGGSGGGTSGTKTSKSDKSTETKSSRKFLPTTKKVLADIGKTTFKGLAKAAGTVGHVEHVAKEWVTDNVKHAVSLLPAKVQTVVKGAWMGVRLGGKVAFATYIAGQSLAEEVAQARGATPEQAKRLRGVLSIIDLTAAKVPTVVGLVFPVAFALEPASFVPIGSLTYLAYSTARDPMATIRGAQSLVKKTAAKLGIGSKKKMAKADHKELVGRLFDFLTDDNRMAILLAALDETSDLEEALSVAKEASSRPVEFAAGFDDEEHPRGQPDNDGQFAPKEGTKASPGKSGSERSKERRTEKTPSTEPETPARPNPEHEKRLFKVVTQADDDLHAAVQSGTISQEQADQYRERLVPLLESMSPPALELLHENLNGFQWYGSNADVDAAYREGGPPEDPHLTHVDGFYDPDTKTIHLADGNEGLYSEELAHAIDGPNHAISSTKEWDKAYRHDRHQLNVDAHAVFSAAEWWGFCYSTAVADPETWEVVAQACHRSDAVLRRYL